MTLEQAQRLVAFCEGVMHVAQHVWFFSIVFAPVHPWEPSGPHLLNVLAFCGMVCVRKLEGLA